MRIGEITFSNRNDFKFIAECSCGKSTRVGDGYADAYYQRLVFPDRQCGLNEHGETAEQKEARYAARRASGLPDRSQSRLRPAFTAIKPRTEGIKME